MSLSVTPVGETVAELGEGPCWDPATETLVWVDILAGRIHRTTPSLGHTTTLLLDPPVSLAVPASDGELVVALRHRIAVLGADGGTRPLAAITADRAIRFNDGACDLAGRLWVGTMHEARMPGMACLYRLDDARLTPVVRGVTVSNGLDWSPDGHALYYVDTPTLRVDVFDHDPRSGALSGRRTFVDLSDAAGRPDGLTVDADGGVWVALIAGGALHRYTDDGRLDTVVDLPVSHPTSCAFGGADLRDLYVTTARAPLDAEIREAQPLAGRLLRLRPPVGGVPGRPHRPGPT